MSVTPDFIGQRYKDTNTGNIWIANSTTPGDWTLEVQNMHIKWTPTTAKVYETMAYSTINGWGEAGLVNATSVILDHSTTRMFLGFVACYEVLTISVPALTGMFGANAPDNLSLSISQCDVLSSISIPVLTHCDAVLKIDGNNALTSVDLSSLVEVDVFTVGSVSIQISSNPLLVNLSLPSFVPKNGQNFAFSSNALNLASVDGLLARFVANAAYVSGTITISGGTNAAPTTGAGSPHDILIGRGVGINHN